MSSQRSTLRSLRGFLVFTLALLGLTAAAGYAVGAAQQPVTGPDESHLRGQSNSGVTLSATALTNDAVATATGARGGAPASWGVLAFKSQTGLTCLTAGPVRHGVVGYQTASGFAALDPADAPANCGDIREDLRTRGAIALITQQPVDAHGSAVVGLVYGAVGPLTKSVKVRLPSGAERPLRITATTAVDTFAGTFLAALPHGQDARGVQVMVTMGDGSVHKIEF